jgi:hypothetical protein
VKDEKTPFSNRISRGFSEPITLNRNNPRPSIQLQSPNIYSYFLFSSTDYILLFIQRVQAMLRICSTDKVPEGKKQGKHVITGVARRDVRQNNFKFAPISGTASVI